MGFGNFVIAKCFPLGDKFNIKGVINKGLLILMIFSPQNQIKLAGGCRLGPVTDQVNPLLPADCRQEYFVTPAVTI